MPFRSSVWTKYLKENFLVWSFHGREIMSVLPWGAMPLLLQQQLTHADRNFVYFYLA